MKVLKLMAAALMMVTAAKAQKGIEDGSKFGHGEDSARCVMAWVQYGDAYKLKAYADAYPHWYTVFNECPLADKNIFSRGATIVKNVYKLEKDETKKAEYYDLLMRVYDQRIKYQGNNKKYPTSWIKGMKALDILTYKPNDLAASKEAYGLLSESLKGDPTTIDAAFTQKYLLAAIDLFKASEIGAEEVVNSYVVCSDALAAMLKVADDKKKENINEAKNQVEQIFAQSGAADCETIIKIFTPQLEENKDNIDWLKKVNRFLDRGDCTEEELYYATSENMHKIEPMASSARGLARMYMKKNDLAKASQYYNEAIELEEDPMMKAKYYNELAAVYFSESQFGQAKAACYNAIKNRGDWGAPYLMLGRIYAAGSKLVGSEDWEKRAGYWVAIDKFAKAKAVDESCAAEATELIRQYSQYFPSKEDLFMHGMQVGQSYTVGGFIGETTTVRAK